jgi:hypothetical protein
MRALVATALGVLLVDLDDEEVLEAELPEGLPPPADCGVTLPRLVAADRSGSTVVAVVDRKPPLLVSHDAGTTWREAGGGLPSGRAVAIAADDPDVVLFAGTERLYLSLDGARFWRALSLELPEITAVAFADD